MSGPVPPITPWPELPLRRIGKIVNGGTPRAEGNLWNGEIPFITPPDLRPVIGSIVTHTERTLTEEGVRSGSSIVPAGSVMLSIRAPIGYVARTSTVAAFNQGCRAIVPSNEHDARFVAYALIVEGDFLDSIGRGTTFMEVSTSQLAEVRIPTPPLGEQQAIAYYLDHETMRIDELIAEQRGLIETLRERRSAVIDRASLGEMDPLDSQVVGAWPVAAIGYGFNVKLGKMLDSGKKRAERASDLRYIRAGNIQDTGLDLSAVNEMPFTPEEASKFDLKRGDLLVVEGGAIGTCVVLDEDMPGWAFQKTVNRLRSAKGWSPRYYRYVLTAYRDRGVLDILSNKSTIAHFTAEKLRGLRVPVPPIDEQRRIAAYLDEQTSRIDNLIAESEDLIALSQERRAALITAAVTGQIDVRTAA